MYNISNLNRIVLPLELIYPQFYREEHEEDPDYLFENDDYHAKVGNNDIMIYNEEYSQQEYSNEYPDDNNRYFNFNGY